MIVTHVRFKSYSVERWVCCVSILEALSFIRSSKGLFVRGIVEEERCSINQSQLFDH